MSDVAILYLGVGVLFACVFACVFGLVWAARWALGREAERTAAATFDRDFIPEAADVADQDYPAIVAEIEALLDDAREHVERLVFAAECAEWMDAGGAA